MARKNSQEAASADPAENEKEPVEAVEETAEIEDPAEGDEDDEDEEEADEAEEEEEEEDPAAAKPVKAPKKKAKPASKRPKKSKKAVDGFEAYAAKAQRAFPNATMIASEAPTQHLSRISTGNLSLDIATYGGWPRGRIARLFGKEKSAKTGSCLNTIAQWQKHCGACYERFDCHPECEFKGKTRPKAAALWIDAENRLESMWYWVEGHGIDLDRLLVMSPPDGQHIIDFVDATIRERGAGIGLIVVDSVANITSHEEINKPTMKGRNAPVNAQLLNRGLRKWINAVQSLGVTETRRPTVILINQMRLTLDQYHPETQPGGEGMKYATSIDVRFGSGKFHYLIEGENGLEDKTTGYNSKWKPAEEAAPDYVEVNFRVTASGVCPPGRFGQFNYWIRSGHGRRIGDPDNVERLWEYVKRLDLLQKEGRNYTLFTLSGATQAEVKEQFDRDTHAQATVWGEIIKRYITNV